MKIPRSKKAHIDCETNTSGLILSIINENELEFTAEQIFALSQLTWYDKGISKLRALNTIYKKNYDDISDFLKDNEISDQTKEYISQNTGYTNLYPVYRNSSFKWIQENLPTVQNIIELALDERINDKSRLRIASLIDRLPGISKPNSKIGKMSPASLLSPLIICLDKENRFPIINKASAVVDLYRKLKISNLSVPEQVRELLKILDNIDINNAFELDVMSRTVINMVTPVYQKKKIEREQVNEIGRGLLDKDDDDVEYFVKTRKIKLIRLHNAMTNKLRDFCQEKNINVIEGTSVKYDAIIEKYNGKDNLLIEVKSSNTSSDVRLGIGQLFDYKHMLQDENIHLALYVPEKPERRYIDLLKKLGIVLMWDEGNSIYGLNM